MAALSIRPLTAADRAAWEVLWKGYLAFYQTTLPAFVSERTWKRLLDPAEPIAALGAFDGGRLIGITHYLFHRSTWAPECYCYLEDLFVDETARGKGAARGLIEAVEAAGRKAGATRLYWITHTTNARARGLYDRVAEHTGFIQYRKAL